MELRCGEAVVYGYSLAEALFVLHGELSRRKRFEKAWSSQGLKRAQPRRLAEAQEAECRRTG